MPRLKSFTVCRSLEKAAGTEDIIRTEALTDVFPTALPGELARATVVSSWEFALVDVGRDFEVTLVIKAPGRASVSFPMRLSKDKCRFQTIRDILGIPLEQPGPLLFEVLLNGKVVATHTVHIHQP